MKKGDRINLKDGRMAIITGFSLPDFIGDAAVINYQIVGTAETGFVMFDELAIRGEAEEKTGPRRDRSR